MLQRPSNKKDLMKFITNKKIVYQRNIPSWNQMELLTTKAYILNTRT